MLALADLLRDTPAADSEAALEAALYTRERFVEVREQCMTEDPDNPDLPSIENVANLLNDTIAELSSAIVKAGRHAAAAALPEPRSGESAVLGADAVPADVINVEHQIDATLADAANLRSALGHERSLDRIDQSRHYHFLNLSISNVEFRVKAIGAMLKAPKLEMPWLEKTVERLGEAKAAFDTSWNAVRNVLQQAQAIAVVVDTLVEHITDLITFMRSFISRIVANELQDSHDEERLTKSLESQIRQELVPLAAGRSGELGRRTDHFIRLWTSSAGRFTMKFGFLCGGRGRHEESVAAFIEVEGRFPSYRTEHDLASMAIEKVEIVWPNRFYVGRGPYVAAYEHLAGEHFKLDLYGTNWLCEQREDIMDLLRRSNLTLDEHPQITDAGSTTSIHFAGSLASEEEWYAFCANVEALLDPIQLALTGPRPWKRS